MRKHLPIVLILLLYLLIGLLFASYTPAWQAPDEPAHYNYIRQLAAGYLPVIEAGDYDQEYITEVVFESGFAPTYSLDSLEYEDWQPPLYYLLLTPVYWLTDGSLLALRLTSLIMGAGLVVLAYSIAKKVTGHDWLGWTTAVFIALLPQHLALLAAINNDALAELLIAAILWQLVSLESNQQQLKPDHQSLNRHWFTIGLLLGLGFLTKGTVYVMAPVIGLALLWHYWDAWPTLGRASWCVAVPALLLGSLWWGRNIAIYGGLDILGKTAHDAVVIGQPRTADWIAQFGLWGTIQRFLQTTFNSFWGQFGWMTLPMNHPSWLYPLLQLFTAIIILGLIAHTFQKKRHTPHSTLRAPRSTPRTPHLIPHTPLILLTTFLLTATLHIGYNLTFVQHQGRYLFPALVPISIGVAVSMSVWGRPFNQRWPVTQNLLPLGLALALASLDLFALFRIIVPNLS